MYSLFSLTERNLGLMRVWKELRELIPAQNLSGHEYVTVEVRATTVGIGNLTGVLGSDGDRLGFALTVRGVEGLVVEVERGGVGPSLSEQCLESLVAMHIHRF